MSFEQMTSKDRLAMDDAMSRGDHAAVGELKKRFGLPAVEESMALEAIHSAKPRSIQMNDAAIENEIQAKGLNAPRLSPQKIEDTIDDEIYFNAYNAAEKAWQAGSKVKVHGKAPDALKLLTICVLVLKNGFTVTGESACASPENYDAEIGRKVARQKAVEKIWPLEGYLLRQKLSEG
jgi:hypothetical protein